MAFENQSNIGRVERMQDLLKHILKSARSNRATPEEVVALLKPLTDDLSSIGVRPETAKMPTPVASGGYSVSGPQWANVRDMAEQAELKDLTVAMAVMMNRIEEIL